MKVQAPVFFLPFVLFCFDYASFVFHQASNPSFFESIGLLYWHFPLFK